MDGALMAHEDAHRTDSRRQGKTTPIAGVYHKYVTVEDDDVL
jgi:hypothetical protein